MLKPLAEEIAEAVQSYISGPDTDAEMLFVIQRVLDGRKAAAARCSRGEGCIMPGGFVNPKAADKHSAVCGGTLSKLIEVK